MILQSNNLVTTDVLDFDADGDMAFAPTDNAKNVVYDIERGREALQGDISRGNGVTWSMQSQRVDTKTNDVLWTITPVTPRNLFCHLKSMHNQPSLSSAVLQCLEVDRERAQENRCF